MSRFLLDEKEKKKIIELLKLNYSQGNVAKRFDKDRAVINRLWTEYKKNN